MRKSQGGTPNHADNRKLSGVTLDRFLAIAIATAAIVQTITLIVQAKITGSQLSAMKGQNETSRQQLEEMQQQRMQTEGIVRVQQRPWLAVESLTMSNFELNKGIELNCVVNNFGKTPARIRYSQLQIYIDNLAARRVSGMNVAQTVSPGEEFRMHLEEGPVVPGNMFNMISRNESVLQVVVEIAYSSHSGSEDYLTARRYIWRPELKQFRLSSQGNVMR